MKRRAFTLIEVLVVIAIIALLTVISMPALRAARNRARMMVCGSNQRQLLFSFTLYQQETGVLPYGFCDDGLGTTMTEPPEGYAGTGNDKRGWWWFSYLQNVTDISVKKGSVVWCPSRKVFDPENEGNVLCGNYGVNRSVCKDAQGLTSSVFSSDPLRAGLVKRFSATMLISDSGYSLLSWMAAVDTGGDPFENPDRISSFYIPGLPMNRSRTELTGNPDAIKGRHPRGKLNIGFMDGHTALRSPESFSVGVEYTGPGDVHLPSFWEP
ncbi:MAG: type II secretion system protein [Planctomycetota bacterium]|jgi:prepilin-type N-terminal cleavage/methylation domain-containing protein/prepilin-type processing-associated H-X9-DG protein